MCLSFFINGLTVNSLTVECQREDFVLLRTNVAFIVVSLIVSVALLRQLLLGTFVFIIFVTTTLPKWLLDDCATSDVASGVSFARTSAILVRFAMFAVVISISFIAVITTMLQGMFCVEYYLQVVVIVVCCCVGSPC